MILEVMGTTRVLPIFLEKPFLNGLNRNAGNKSGKNKNAGNGNVESKNAGKWNAGNRNIVNTGMH